MGHLKIPYSHLLERVEDNHNSQTGQSSSCRDQNQGSIKCKTEAVSPESALMTETEDKTFLRGLASSPHWTAPVRPLAHVFCVGQYAVLVSRHTGCLDQQRLQPLVNSIRTQCID